MTMTPTQAQIDAAAKAVCQYRDVDPCPGKPCEDCIDKAKAALTAAAAVGDKTVGYCDECGVDLTHTSIAVTIERCAQVADERAKIWQRVMRHSIESECKEIAAAIRALTAAADDTFAVEEYLRGLKSGTRATIERCAQVVESFNQRVMQRKDPDAIAAAIRALKDKS